MKRDIKKHVETLKEILNEWNFNNIMENIQDKIKQLEPLYMTGSIFSDEFKNEAYKERQYNCLISSFLYEYARENNIKHKF